MVRLSPNKPVFCCLLVDFILKRNYRQNISLLENCVTFELIFHPKKKKTVQQTLQECARMQTILLSQTNMFLFFFIQFEFAGRSHTEHILRMREHVFRQIVDYTNAEFWRLCKAVFQSILVKERTLYTRLPCPQQKL